MCDEPKKRTRAWMTWAGWLAFFIVPPLYLLASGPEVWLVDHGYLSIRTSLIIDWPINFYCQHDGLGWRYIRNYQRRFLDYP
ncbi:MAG TPA: hypothetical protein VGP63_29155 [Planctomycetaceae bacterium]|jgi:hypothetical protein|nr:hypothetical protein [Planctomycetaceae bacterium]